jgi:large subunit ribosomal protein L22
MKAILRTIRISPKKANLVAGTVRGKKVNDALAILKFMPKKGADILYKVVHSAASNAKNNFNQNMEELSVMKILVTKGPTYKRSIPISRGRAHPIRKRTSHITVEVGVEGVAGPVEPVKAEGRKEKEAPKSRAEGNENASEAKKAEKKTVPKKAAAKKPTKAAKSAQ